MQAMVDSSVVLSLQGVSKRFGAVQAVDDVSVEFRSGEVHAVVGENGSGKSTLLGIASGTVEPDSGAIRIAGEDATQSTAAEAQRLGLGMAYQTFSQVGEFTVAENLYLGAPAEVRPPYRDMDAWAMEQLRAYDLDLPPRAGITSLSLAERQFLEVVRALLSDPRVLVLDEPTTALGPEGVRRLHDLIAGMANGGVGVIYVSHRLPEVLGVADRVTVLRDGVSQGTFDAADVDEERVVALMIGRSLDRAFPERAAASEGGDVRLELDGLRGDRFGPIDLAVRRGEVLGLAGAEGNGQPQLLRAIAGVGSVKGEARCDGERVNLRAPWNALRAGIVFLSGDRGRESVFSILGVRANATLQIIGRLSRAGRVSKREERRTVHDIVRRLRLRTASIEQPVQFLSGGNQQKVALARPFLHGALTVILAEEPTQGVDVRSRFEIYEALRAKASEGIAVIVKSSDPIELAGLCDRVAVMSRGVIVDELSGDVLSERRIVESMVGSGSVAGEPGEIG